jgi:large subunit ribosomal protein L21
VKGKDMKYAIVKSGGKQIKAVAGESIIVEKLNVEGNVELNEVLAVYDGKKLHIGKPTVKSAVVKTEVLKHGKGKKIKILRTKAKSN